MQEIKHKEEVRLDFRPPAAIAFGGGRMKGEIALLGITSHSVEQLF